MNSQELRALQEAYSQVYELDEAKVDKDKTMVQKIKSRNERSGIDSTPQRRLRTQAMRGIGKGGGFQSRSNPQRINDSYDLYDIILSHLLDEGYADTEQAAEAIMVNMSGDWRESIVEAVVSTTGQVNPPIKPGPMFPKAPNMGANRPYEDPFINPSGSRALKGASNPIKKDTKTA
jgi:hypothetical protein